MKSLLISLALLTSSTFAFANADVSGMKTFPITQAEISAAHFDQEFKTGSLIVNYDEKMVTLVLNREFHCSQDLACAEVMPAPKVVQLPITSVESGNCGATVIQAQDDARNRDGIFQQISVIDNTTMVCRILLPYQGTATYTTSAYDHQLGTEVVQTSRMVLAGRASKINFKF